MSELATRAKLVSPGTSISSRRLPSENDDPGAFIEWQAQMLGCEAKVLEATYRNLEEKLATAPPAIIRLRPSQFIAALEVRRGVVSVLSPAREVVKLPLRALCETLRFSGEEPIRDQYRDLLREAEIRDDKSDRAIRQLVDGQTGQHRFRDAWTLRAALNTSFRHFLMDTGVMRKGSSLVIAHLAQYVFWLASWQILGQLLLQGRMDRGWMLAWVLLLLGIVPLRTLTTWMQGSLATEIGMSLKRRLLLGALNSNPDDVRRQGIGSLLGQAFEAEAVERLALSGGITGVLTLVEIAVSAFVLGKISILLGAWCVLTGGVGWAFLRRNQAWTGTRMEMTGE